MHEGEDAYYVTDLSVVSLAIDLSRTSPPLLRLEREAAGHGVLRGRVSITDAGRAVLDTRQDRVAACGVDRWLGGVHLQGRSVAWRWDEARRGIVASDAKRRPPPV
jgi:hypothetical protein